MKAGGSRREQAQLRRFGLGVAFGLSVAAAYQAVRHQDPAWTWALIGPAFVFLAGATLAPALLAPFQRGVFWLRDRFARLLAFVVLGIIYYTVVLAVGLMVRWRRQDILEADWSPGSSETYWRPVSPQRPDITKPY